MIPSHYLNKCVRIIEENCYRSPSSVFAGNTLAEFCSRPKNLEALRLLNASGEIQTDMSDGTERPYLVWLTDKGALHRYTVREKRISAIKGFIAGILSTIISTQLVPYLISFLPFWLPQ